ncbi:MAG: cell division septal protein, partial [Blautia sp.]|nr:cell division septal protein [Blautia sp.]
MEGKGKGFLLFLLLAALAFGGYAFYDYYRVEAVEVLSEGRYSEEEVKSMVLHGFAAKNSFLAQRLLTKENISGIPFVESLRVTSLARDKIAIIVIEKKPVGCLKYLGSYVYFDRNGIFLEGQREREPYIPFFSTLEVDSVIQGERLDIKGRHTVLNAAVTLSSFMTKNQMEVDSVEFDENYHFYFRVNQIQVNLGTEDLLDEKLNRV